MGIALSSLASAKTTAAFLPPNSRLKRFIFGAESKNEQKIIIKIKGDIKLLNKQLEIFYISIHFFIKTPCFLDLDERWLLMTYENVENITRKNPRKWKVTDYSKLYKLFLES